jgi:CheY-like chemotaxis protein
VTPRVLVIDDDPLLATAIRRGLKDGNEVTVENDPRDALERIRAGAPLDVILCDLTMPHLSGVQLYREVCRIRPELAARFVFLTGGAFTAETLDFLDQVPNARITKPYRLAHLRQVVEQIAAQPSSHAIQVDPYSVIATMAARSIVAP